MNNRFWLAGCMVGVALGALGVQVEYVGEKGGDWFEAKNWIPNGVPGEGDSVLISNRLVKCFGTAAVKDLKIYWGELQTAGLDVSGDVDLSCGALMTVGSGVEAPTRAHVGGGVVASGSSQIVLNTPEFHVGGDIRLGGAASVVPARRDRVTLTVGNKTSVMSGRMGVGNGMNELEPMYPKGVPLVFQSLHWIQRFQEKAALSAKEGKKARVIFMGDSITHFWDTWNTGLAVRNEVFAKEPYNALFFGHAGDRTQQLLWRIENGEMDGCDPSVVVLMIGTNNNLGVGDEKCEVPLGVVTVVETVRKKFPNARIILHPIFPAVVNESDYARAMGNLMNQELVKLCDGVNVIWCDFNSQFLAEDGSIPKEMMSDAVHPTTAGYRIWAKNLKPVLDRALAAKPGERVEGLVDPKAPRWTGFKPTVAAAMANGRFGMMDRATKMNGWAHRLMENRVRVRALPRGQKYEVVYLGDTDEAHLPPVVDGVKVLNGGYEGDKTQNVLWRVHMGELTGFFANVIVLKVGDRNIADGDSADDVFAGIKACVAALRRLQRYSNVVILPVSGDGAVAKDVNARLVSEKWEGPVRVKTAAWEWAKAYPDSFR